jgi:hypothetical protein
VTVEKQNNGQIVSENYLYPSIEKSLCRQSKAKVKAEAKELSKIIF